MGTIPATTFVDGLSFGEGPRWHDGRLWYSDFFSETVWSVAPDDPVARAELHVPGRPSGLGWLGDGRLLVVSMTTRTVLRREADAAVVRHADLRPFAAHPANDMLVHPRGDAYVGHFGFDLEGFFAGRAEPAPTTLLRVSPDGAVAVAAEDLFFPNGMVLFGATLVVAETFGMRLSSFEVGTDATLGGRRVWAPLEGCFPDGLCGDADGTVWVANAQAPECLRVAEGGRVLQRVVTSQPCFACALGGDDRRTLFCFTAPTSGSRRRAAREAKIEVARVTVPGGPPP